MVRECEQFISRTDSMMRFRRWLPGVVIEHVQTYADPPPEEDDQPGETIIVRGGPTTAMGGAADSVELID